MRKYSVLLFMPTTQKKYCFVKCFFSHILDQLVDRNHKTEIRQTEKVINIRNRGYQKLIGQNIVNQLVRELAVVIMSSRDNNGLLRDSGERRDSRNLSSHCCVVTPPSPTTTDKRLVPSASGVTSRQRAVQELITTLQPVTNTTTDSPCTLVRGLRTVSTLFPVCVVSTLR